MCHVVGAKTCDRVLKLLDGLKTIVRQGYVYLHPLDPDRILLFLCVLHLWRVEGEAKGSSRSLTWSSSRVFLTRYEPVSNFRDLLRLSSSPQVIFASS